MTKIESQLCDINVPLLFQGAVRMKVSTIAYDANDNTQCDQGEEKSEYPYNTCNQCYIPSRRFSCMLTIQTQYGYLLVIILYGNWCIQFVELTININDCQLQNVPEKHSWSRWHHLNHRRKRSESQVERFISFSSQTINKEHNVYHHRIICARQGNIFSLQDKV